MCKSPLQGWGAATSPCVWQAARGTAASATKHPEHVACWIQSFWENGDEYKQKLSREGVLWDPVQEKLWLKKFWSDAPVSCMWPSCTASLGGAKLKSIRRAGISFGLTLIWLCCENGLIPISHHSVFQKHRKWSLCSCYGSPFGHMVPRSEKMNQRLNLAGKPNKMRSNMFHDFNLPCKFNAVWMGAWRSFFTVFCPDLHFSSPLALSYKSDSESYTSAQVLALSPYILSRELTSFTALK